MKDYEIEKCLQQDDTTKEQNCKKHKIENGGDNDDG